MRGTRKRRAETKSSKTRSRAKPYQKPPAESGATFKSHENRITVALCYPNAYGVAMGNLGFHQVYHLLNAYDDVACERAVLDPDHKTPKTIESGRRLREFEIIAFSVSYETDLLNLILMLSRAGVPLDPRARDQENAPLILFGGVIAFMNPEPLAPLADLIAVGEAEAILPDFLEEYRKSRQKPRHDLFAAMARVPGIYLPSLYRIEYRGNGTIEARRPLIPEAPEVVRRRYAPDLSQEPAVTRVFTDRAEFCDLALVELSRGCAHGCRFCAGAFIYRPPRWTPEHSIKKALEQGFAYRDRAGLVAASATDHPQIDQLRSWIREQGKVHSVASLRLDRITPALLADIRDCGHKTLTVAPEAGTERMRRIINKPITDKKIEAAAEMIGASGIPRLKLYFQVGLPGETEEDIRAVPRLVVAIKKALARGAGKKSWGGAVSISINPFVPKPGTPFQWQAMLTPAELGKRLKFLGASLRKMGGVSVSGTSVREAVLQGVIAWGDRRTGAALIRGLLAGKSPMASLRAKDSGAPLPEWYLYRERAFAEVLPWDFIDHGVEKSALWQEYEKAKAGKTSPPCNPGQCELCGACPKGPRERIY